MKPISTAGTLRGMAVMAGAVFLFAAVDTQVKFLTDSLSPLQIAWSRQLGLLVVFITMLATRGLRILCTNHLWLQLLRGMLSASSAILYILALAYIPLADAIAMTFVAPFFIAILGAVLLGETVGLHRWVAICLGFVGALIISRPGSGIVHPAIFLVMIEALLFALWQVITRKIGQSDQILTTIAYTSLIAGLLLSIPLPFVWQAPNGGFELFLMISIAFMAALAEIMMIYALILAMSVVIAPIHYTLLLWGAIFGWFVFGDIPDIWTCSGALLIAITGFYLLKHERAETL